MRLHWENRELTVLKGRDVLVGVELRELLRLVRSLEEVAHLEPATLRMGREDDGADSRLRQRHGCVFTRRDAHGRRTESSHIVMSVSRDSTPDSMLTLFYTT